MKFVSFGSSAISPETAQQHLSVRLRGGDSRAHIFRAIRARGDECTQVRVGTGWAAVDRHLAAVRTGGPDRVSFGSGWVSPAAKAHCVRVAFGDSMASTKIMEYVRDLAT
jgi:hypothetical protein